MLRLRVTVVGGIQDQIVFALSRGKLHSPSQVLPTVHIESLCPNQFHVAPFTLSLALSEKTACVFTKDLKRLMEALQETDDEAMVIQQYEDVLAPKYEVRFEFRSDLGNELLTYLEVRKNVGKAGTEGASRRKGRTCSGPRQTG